LLEVERGLPLPTICLGSDQLIADIGEYFEVAPDALHALVVFHPDFGVLEEHISLLVLNDHDILAAFPGFLRTLSSAW
jgi:hypothetical protein